MKKQKGWEKTCKRVIQNRKIERGITVFSKPSFHTDLFHYLPLIFNLIQLKRKLQYFGVQHYFKLLDTNFTQFLKYFLLKCVCDLVTLSNPSVTTCEADWENMSDVAVAEFWQTDQIKLGFNQN